MIQLYKNILRNRAHQLLINELMKKKVFNPVHLAVGHEGLSETINLIVDVKDEYILTHRNIAFNLSREKNIHKIIAELKYQKEGISHGMMGSMNMINVKKNINYSSSILGNNFSVGLGVSIANSKLSKKNKLTLVVTGDGAIEEGSFYETIILASSFKVPLCIIVINDDFAMASKIHERRRSIDLSKIAKSMSIRYLKIEKGDILKKKDILKSTINYSKYKSKLSIIECKLNTFNGHCGPSPGWPDDPKKLYLEKGLIVSKNKNDEAYLIKKKIGNRLFSQLEKQNIQYARKILTIYK